MARLVVFNQVSLDGYFAGPGGDLRWAHGEWDPEFQEFVEGNAKGGGTLVFGRVTYEMMAGFWPTPMARERDPVVARRMNALPKIVFSRTLRRADWTNTRLVKRGLLAEIRRLKQARGRGLTILGSGRLVAQLAQAGLVDEFVLVLCPVVLGGGRTLFEGVRPPRPLRLVKSRAFANGKVVLFYRPAK